MPPTKESPVKTTFDILHSAARPQRRSFFEPQKIDWRWRTGVIRTEDFEDDRKNMTIWDQAAEEALLGRRGLGSGRRRRVKNGVTASAPARLKFRDAEEEEKGERAGRDGDGEEGTPTPILVTPRKLRRERTLAQVEKYTSERILTEVGLEEVWEQTALVVVLRPEQTPVPPDSIPTTPNTPRFLRATDISQVRDSYKRPFVDESRPFSALQIRRSIRTPDQEALLPPIPSTYHWYPDAVPVDALFPPGVPLSGKEILVFYPHHPRNKCVGLRLINNNYKGADVVGISAWFRGVPKSPILPSIMNDHLCTIGRHHFGDGKWSLVKYEGRPCRNLYTDDLVASELVQKCGYSLPTFDDLLKGLVYLPDGLDARGLTEALAWYVQHRNLFSPRLLFNVMHTRDLVRALQIPLKPIGKRNLDKTALEDWRANGTFEKREVAKLPRTFWEMEEAKAGLPERVSLHQVLLGPLLSWSESMMEAATAYLDEKEAEQRKREVKGSVQKRVKRIRIEDLLC
ncbi:hypothetical protein BCR34DRAFT_588204 [Clohesyomyces aquaticus]|uniref:Uncharacterized protein n=1 Tax=Clohesyomyces aquaticus TaxID=1231657 RepID=A0A1Y1ZLD0_9PLEO|nr:hypothetical protein BCR34DRAFT_588204 [Clohesyomyces aquaticus]